MAVLLVTAIHMIKGGLLWARRYGSGWWSSVRFFFQAAPCFGQVEEWVKPYNFSDDDDRAYVLRVDGKAMSMWSE